MSASVQVPLPPELLLTILEQLPDCCLRVAGEVCRGWRDFVLNSRPLRYRLALTIAGQGDNPFCELKFRSKLRMLQQYETAWASKRLFVPTLAKTMVVPLGASVLDYQCAQGVLALRVTNPARTAQVLHLKRFGSPLRGVPEAIWSIPIHPQTRTFAIDPSRDLAVVVVERSPDLSLLTTCASLSTGEGRGWRLPLGVGLNLVSRCVESVKIRMNRSFLAILLIGRPSLVQLETRHELAIYSLDDGIALIQMIPNAGNTVNIADVAFIDDQYLMAACTTIGGSISILRVYELHLLATLPRPARGRPSFTFRLPSLKKAKPPASARISSLHLVADSCFSNATPNSPHPFIPSPDARVLVLLMDIKHTERCGSQSSTRTLSFTVHIPAILKHIQSAQSAPENTIIFPWSVWGAQASRAEPVQDGRLHGGMDGRGWLPYGSRYVRQSLRLGGLVDPREQGRVSASEDNHPEEFKQSGLYLYDFNQAAICSAIARSGIVPTTQTISGFFESRKPTSLGDGYDYHIPPSQLPSEYRRLFRDKIITHLPFRKRRIDVVVSDDDAAPPAGCRVLGKHESVPLVALSEDTLVIQRGAHRELLVVQLAGNWQ